MAPVAVEGPATLATSAANHLLFICVNEKMFHVRIPQIKMALTQKKTGRKEHSKRTGEMLIYAIIRLAILKHFVVPHVNETRR